MLILTRRVGQSVKIGDDVEITVVQVSGDQVRLGISAPARVKVYRAEVLVQIAEENARAAASAGGLEDAAQALSKVAEEGHDKAPPGAQVPPAAPDNETS